ncbi:iron-containing alcohol dehydrogenase [Sulfoacidibacillus thermotolerans]|uniref:NADH-dependent alcohol dehydrogenase n=1 Tax=Sulfoacidibacillus thermotolerans TaxID=1765684 RepID=A0A2U3DAI5_SULT2|nr:iron-containing alcohol dehydrogenase [Sulfoacidibacillus thermotolerans]PWI58308.1 NADH-dependent alcohol dehydrogenase [Sulfoacidibacillus thermotolerans]
MNPFVFWNPTVLYYGQNQIEQHLVSEVKKYGSKVLLVYGGGSIKTFGLYDKVVNLLKSADITVFEFSGVEPNPRLTTVHRAIELCRQEEIDLLLAVGGGSVLDATKAIAAGVPYEGDVWDFYQTQKRPNEALPFGTILTLAATGSEMNSGGVITNWETKEKIGSSSPLTFPKFSFCDAENTFTVSREQTMYGIVDMFSHVLEAYFSHTPNTFLQERLMESVMQTIIENAQKVLDHPHDFAARETIMYCGTMALNGMISMGVQGDWATHAIEHEVSAIYDIPHGGGLAILFPNWMNYVLDAGIDRFYQLATRVFHIDSAGKSQREVAQEGILAVRRFFTSLGAPRALSDYQIGAQEIERMAEHAVRIGPIGHYKKLEREDVAAILRAAL